MPTNKQDKRDGPTTEEQKPHPGTPNPNSLLPLLTRLSTSLSLSLISPLISRHSLSLYFPPLQHVSHLTSSFSSWINTLFSFFFFFSSPRLKSIREAVEKGVKDEISAFFFLSVVSHHRKLGGDRKVLPSVFMSNL